MITTAVKDLPFTEAVIDEIISGDGYTYFKVVSKNCYGKRFKIKDPKNKQWLDSDAYSRGYPLAVKVIREEKLWMGTPRIYGSLVPNYIKSGDNNE